ncbi:MAG: hypothetical protein GTN62_11140 [Gemmatimonadales bacterium]|nr:hypothetical protein [Gemmatimonadales bacterium]NIN12236.1 hypothetical protein [Gemmatimonadales bacterium]NIN50651.1 hypothetical protein [Gemmatimonadales bacterium]NIP08115.1 hypothetical protein [Gemmatimonadales bacterium]NIR03405.1 hypothetical protein [Gemmatimonadales bacterium]
MPLPRAVTKAIAFTVLAASLVAEGSVLYLVNDPPIRLALGLVALVPIMWSIVWATRRPDILEGLPAAAPPIHKRRYLRLRAKVKQLIDEITRLNWTVVDAKRGIRNQEEAKKEADTIEEGLHNLIRDIRSSAGELASDEEWD